MTDTISIPELLWTFVAAFSFVVNVAALLDAIGDRRYLRESGLNGIRGHIASANVRTEASRVWIQLSFIAIGVLAWQVPPRPAEAGGALLTWVMASGFIVVALILVGNSILDRRTRRLVLAALRERRWTGEERRRDG